MSRRIPRVVLWLLIAVALWEGFVYLSSRPRFWVQVAVLAHRIGTSALRIHARASARTGDTVTDIEEYLRQERSP